MVVDTRVSGDRVLCGVHGIVFDTEFHSDNIRLHQETFGYIIVKLSPKICVEIKMILLHRRNTLTSLVVHKKFKVKVLLVSVLEATDSNSLKNFVEHRDVDYFYLTHLRQNKIHADCDRLDGSVGSFQKNLLTTLEEPALWASPEILLSVTNDLAAACRMTKSC